VKKVANQASRVHWHLGQVLLPEHFYAQEESLREELGTRFRVKPAPAWGLASLRWDEYQLQKGTVSVQELTLVLPSGLLVDIPGNTAPVFFDVNAAGAARAVLYAHLQSAYKTVRVGDAGADDGGVERIVQTLDLSTAAYSEGGVEAFRLAEILCGPDGAWSIAPDFLPALLQVGDEPFFGPYLERMRKVARALRQLLVDELKENYLAAEAQAGAKQCLRGLFELQAIIVDLENGIRPHPYEIFRALRAVYIDVSIFRGVHPAGIERPYKHEEPAECIGGFLTELEEHMQVGRSRLPYVEFAKKDGLYGCTLGKDVKKASEVFLLVQKPQVAAKVDMSRVKVASASRLHAVHERSLRGIPIQRLENPPFQHGLASTVDFYSLLPGKEWDYALAEGRIVLFDAPQLEACRLYLYWREA
jgi:type VI secretion system protein ImpJ